MSGNDAVGDVRRVARSFAEAEIAPVATHAEREGRFPHDIAAEAAEADLLAPTIPTEYGGAGLSLSAGLAVTEEFHRADPGIAESVTSATFGCESILAHGTEAQKRAYVEPATRGECITGVAMTEPEAGSDFASIGTTAAREGDDYVLNGEKVFISNGSVADALVVYARTSDPAESHRGITAFLLDTDREGVSRTRMDGYVGPATTDLAQVHLDDVRLPADARLGAEDEGFYQAMAFLEEARLEVAASSLGAARGAFDRTVDYITEREQFGEPVAENQALRHRMADMAMRIESLNAFVYRTAAAVEDDPDGDHGSEAAMAKVLATELAEDVASEAVQLHGGYGMFDEYRVESFLRAAQGPQVYEGTNEILRNVVAADVLGEVEE